MPLQSVLNRFTRQSERRRVPDGLRVYAVGDIHGRADLLDALLGQIARDCEDRGPAERRMIFLGDLIDRGPDSRGVVERLIAFAADHPQARFLMGNHEEVFLRAIGGDLRALRFFSRIGGRETMLSYGVSEADYRDLDYAPLLQQLQDLVPGEHLAFLGAFEDWIEMGDYLFVHAGIRPGLPLEEQSTGDLRWIREEFLHHQESFGRFVIHGHSITREVDLRPNRIGIDTGAYSSGRLTAIGLEGDARWFLST